MYGSKSLCIVSIELLHFRHQNSLNLLYEHGMKLWISGAFYKIKCIGKDPHVTYIEK